MRKRNLAIFGIVLLHIIIAGIVVSGLNDSPSFRTWGLKNFGKQMQVPLAVIREINQFGWSLMIRSDTVANRDKWQHFASGESWDGNYSVAWDILSGKEVLVNALWPSQYRDEHRSTFTELPDWSEILIVSAWYEYAGAFSMWECRASNVDRSSNYGHLGTITGPLNMSKESALASCASNYKNPYPTPMETYFVEAFEFWQSTTAVTVYT